jgi:hypothetical protein
MTLGREKIIRDNPSVGICSFRPFLFLIIPITISESIPWGTGENTAKPKRSPDDL